MRWNVGEPTRGFAYLREAERLAEACGDHRRLGRIASRLIHYFWRMGDYDNALACGPRALAVTRASGDVFEQARAHGTLGTVAQFIAVCRRSEMVAMGTRRPRRGPRLCRR